MKLRIGICEAFVLIALLTTWSNALTEDEEEAEPSPKVVGLFKHLNPLSLLLLKGYNKPLTPKDTCVGLGGTYFDTECLEYFPTPLSFVDARMFCVHKGGDLWVPTIDDLQNPFLYQKLLVQFPNLFKGGNSEFWIGVAKSDTTGFTGVDGVDVSSTALIRTNDLVLAPNFCGVLSYGLGHLSFRSDICSVAVGAVGGVHPFVCEYKLPDNQVVKFQHPFLNKFW